VIRTLRTLALAGAALLLGTACRQDMHDQPRFTALQSSTLFADGRASRPAPEGTVARGELRLDDHLYTGMVDGAPATEFPFPVTAEVLARGEERYAIYCTPCHGQLGSGQGIVVKRGMKAPTSFHDPRLVESPPGYYFDVMTRGYGAMFDLSERVQPEDRWAIAAWIRVLQRSQAATLEDVPSDERATLEAEREEMEVPR
jgi:mono/diheme cytochrome c family protein